MILRRRARSSPGDPARSARSARRWAIGSALLGALGTGLVIAGWAGGSAPPLRPTTAGLHLDDVAGPPAAAHPPAGDRPAARTGPPSINSTAPPRPIWLRIPRLGVASPLPALGLTPDGQLEVPPATADSPAGWYRYSAVPGTIGPSVIVGHVDSVHDGPAVFYRLPDLRPGDRVQVTREDGSVAEFAVRRRVTVAKSRFPSEAVYGPTPRAELRLITCGGSFDRRHGHYRSNVVVFATLTGLRPPGRGLGLPGQVVAL